MGKAANPVGPWDERQEDTLKAMFLTKATLEEMAATLGRTVHSVRSRMRLLDLMTERGRAQREGFRARKGERKRKCLRCREEFLASENYRMCVPCRVYATNYGGVDHDVIS